MKKKDTYIVKNRNVYLGDSVELIEKAIKTVPEFKNRSFSFVTRELILRGLKAYGFECA